MIILTNVEVITIMGGREKAAGHGAESDDGDLAMRYSGKNIGNCHNI